MKSSIYISSKEIEVIGYSKVGGKVSVKGYVTYPLPEGTMINGKITDDAYLVEGLTALRGKEPKLFARPTLTVDGSTIFSRRIVAPRLNKRQYSQLIRDEFSDAVEHLKTPVCDYHLLGSADGASTAILACAVEQAQGASYISTFKAAGIKLNAIRVGVQAILNYVSAKPELRRTTFVLNVIDGVTMLSMLFCNGINVFMSRTRLYSDEYEQLIRDILENLSSLIQFNKSEQFDDIMYSYYLGLSDKDLEFMGEINRYPDIKLETLDVFSGVDGAGKLDANAHFVYLNALLGDDSIDLIRGYNMLGKLEKQRRPKKLWIPVLAGTVVALIIPVVYLLTQITSLYNNIKEINDYITDEAVAAKSEELDRIIEETGYYTGVAKQLTDKAEEESGKASISSQVLDLISKSHSDKVNIILIDFDESTEIIHVSGSSSTETDSAEYVEALKRSRLIKSINYTGYSYSKEGEYNLSIDITLAAKEVVK